MSYMYEFSLYLQKYYTCVSICTLLFVGNKEYLSKKIYGVDWVTILKQKQGMMSYLQYPFLKQLLY